MSCSSYVRDLFYERSESLNKVAQEDKWMYL